MYGFFVAFGLACVATASICLFWKKSTIVRCIGIFALCLAPILFGIFVIAVAMDDWAVVLMVSPFVGLSLIAGALPWMNATTEQSSLFFLKFLGAHLLLILPVCLMFALIPFTAYSESRTVVMLPLLTGLYTTPLSLCITLYLLCRLGITLSRHFKSTLGKGATLILFFLSSCSTLFTLLAILFFIFWAVAASHDPRYSRDDYGLQNRTVTVPFEEPKEPITGAPETFDFESPLDEH
jgi:hypothetical protein